MKNVIKFLRLPGIIIRALSSLENVKRLDDQRQVFYQSWLKMFVMLITMHLVITLIRYLRSTLIQGKINWVFRERNFDTWVHACAEPDFHGNGPLQFSWRLSQQFFGFNFANVQNNP